MRRLHPRTYEQEIQYHLDDGRAPRFVEGHPHRIQMARSLVQKILVGIIDHQAVIVELGCGSGDISGPFSSDPTTVDWAGLPPDAQFTGIVSVLPEEVHGYDMVPMAAQECAERWPRMHFHAQAVEDVEPFECDVLVLCEFLEHVYDPIGIVQKWGPLAKNIVIGHPLVGNGADAEPGHLWAYEDSDYDAWWGIAGHVADESYTFSMGPYPRMIIGRGHRA